MALQDPQKGRIDVALSTFAQRYENAGMIGSLVAPAVPSAVQSAYYWQYGRENLQGAGDDDVRAPGAAAHRIKRTMSKTLFYCPDHSEEDVIPDEERAADAINNPEQDAVAVMRDRQMLKKEQRIATLLTTAGNWPAANKVTLAGNDQWGSGDAAAKPVEDVNTGHSAVKLAIGRKANTLVIGDEVLTALRDNAEVVDRIKYTKLGGVDLSDLAALFDVEQVLVGSAISRSEAGVNSFVWGKHAVLLYVNPTPSTRDVSAAKTFVWTSAPGTVGGFQVELGRATPVSRKSDEVALHGYFDEAFTDSTAGYLIEDAVA